MSTNQQRPTKFCHACGERIDAEAVICPKCGVPQSNVQTSVSPAPAPAYLSQANSKKTAAGLCGILLGGLGVHKFVLGYTTSAIIMLLVTVLSFGLGGIVMGPIGLIEGIIYLTKSDDEFYATYIASEKQWF